ncbi:hypothetical protein GTA08_BOTSDO13321 [Botryosphaeria dothidea]|uniref:Uncharacterized protein n=1 Tax=Botryosphaeria dothidea TaxID=55169 RepID=A0A8H4J0V3_9PEZI|nr:hypothetical protein GTA08_BOTSDO13321 [Botryosphaeria dothidea]
MATVGKSSFIRNALNLLKNAVREEHPIGRHPVSTTPYRADWRAAWLRIGRASTLYVPMAGTVMFWPYAVRAFSKPGGFGHAYHFGSTRAWWEEGAAVGGNEREFSTDRGESRNGLWMGEDRD